MSLLLPALDLVKDLVATALVAWGAFVLMVNAEAIRDMLRYGNPPPPQTAASIAVNATCVVLGLQGIFS